MSRPDPIEYAERLYTAIRAANFSFLAFGNAVKEGVDLRRMPRIAAEPFMRVVGEMLDLEEEAAEDEIIEADLLEQPETAPAAAAQPVASSDALGTGPANGAAATSTEPLVCEVAEPRRNGSES